MDLTEIPREDLAKELESRAVPMEEAGSFLVVGTICSYPGGDVIEWFKKVDSEKDIPGSTYMLRARINSQRNYRIFYFKRSGDFEKLKERLDNDPEGFAEWVNDCESIKQERI